MLQKLLLNTKNLEMKKKKYFVLTSKDLVKSTLHLSFMLIVLSRVQETICASLRHSDFEGPKSFSDSFLSSKIFEYNMTDLFRQSFDASRKNQAGRIIKTFDTIFI